MKLTKSIIALILGFILKKSFAKIKPVIFDGDFASIEMYPYSAFLEIRWTDQSGRGMMTNCGASIVNQRILLTAAHCVSKTSRTELKIKAIVGHNNVTGKNMYQVSSFKVHEKFSSDYLSNDIALLKLENPLKFGKTVKRVAIKKSPPYSGPASVAGWGATYFDATKGSNTLKHVRGLEVWSREECMDWYQVKPEYQYDVPKGTICIGHTFYPKGLTMVGDSGSALVVRDYIQIGLVSQGITVPNNYTDRADKEYFATLQVFTDVRFHYDWILENVEKMYC